MLVNVFIHTLDHWKSKDQWFSKGVIINNSRGCFFLVVEMTSRINRYKHIFRLGFQRCVFFDQRLLTWFNLTCAYFFMTLITVANSNWRWFGDLLTRLRCVKKDHPLRIQGLPYIGTVYGRSPAPVEVGSVSHYLQDFIHPRWCRISSINSIKGSKPIMKISQESPIYSYKVSPGSPIFTIKRWDMGKSY